MANRRTFLVAAAPRSPPASRRRARRTIRTVRSASSCRSRPAAWRTFWRAPSRPKLTEAGHTAVVENRTGGAGVIGADAVAKSPADGYTLLMGLHATQAILVHLQKLPYDPAKDFAPVIHAATVPNVLLVQRRRAGDVAARADRLRQGQSRQADVRVAGQRLDRPHDRRAVQGDGRHRDHPRAVSRRRAGEPGPARRPRQHAVRHRAARGLQPAERQGARARGLRGRAREGAARRADHRGGGTCPAWRRAPGSDCSRPPARRPPRSPGSIARPRRHSSRRRASERFLGQGAMLPLGPPEAFGAHVAAETERWGALIRRAGIRME